MKYYAAMKKNEILPCAATWTDLEGIVLSEVSQKGKYKCYMISFICGIFDHARAFDCVDHNKLWKILKEM